MTIQHNMHVFVPNGIQLMNIIVVLKSIYVVCNSTQLIVIQCPVSAFQMVCLFHFFWCFLSLSLSLHFFHTPFLPHTKILCFHSNANCLFFLFFLFLSLSFFFFLNHHFLHVSQPNAATTPQKPSSSGPSFVASASSNSQNVIPTALPAAAVCMTVASNTTLQ